MSAVEVAEVIALLQRAPTTTGAGSLYEHLTKLVLKVSVCLLLGRSSDMQTMACWLVCFVIFTLTLPLPSPPNLAICKKVIEERPSDPVDVLETALLVKSAQGEPREALEEPPAADVAKAAALAKLYG
jgi:hypothetical protein